MQGMEENRERWEVGVFGLYTLGGCMIGTPNLGEVPHHGDTRDGF